MTRLQKMKQTIRYASGLAMAALCATCSEYAFGLLVAYYSLRQVRKLGRLMS